MEYKITAELLKAMVNILQALPYKDCYQVLDVLRKTISDQDASKKAEVKV